MISSKPCPLPKAHLLIPSYSGGQGGVELRHMNLGGGTNIQFLTASLLGRENWRSLLSGSSFLLEKPLIRD